MTTDIQIDPIEKVLADFKRGKMVILIDDEERENEGDLVVAAECVSHEHINFMASHGRGLICLTLTEQKCQQLDLPLMVGRNHSRFSTNFTVSIEAARGVTTGISAQDRALTIRAAVRSDAKPSDIVSPGHIFPIKAQPGGVLTRAGHTEAGSDLARLAGFEPASVICEVLNPDGRMARLPDLIKFGRAHKLSIGTIAALIKYRMQNDPTVERISSGVIKLTAGQFQTHLYHDIVEGGVHLALVHGEIDPAKPTPVRVHVHRGLLDAVFNHQAKQSWDLENVLAAIAAKKNGVVVILSYNESVDSLRQRIELRAELDKKFSNKVRDKNNITDEKYSNNNNREVQNSPANLRMLGAGGQILADLKVSKVLALGREKRAYGLAGFGLEIVAYISSPQELNTWYQANELN